MSACAATHSLLTWLFHVLNPMIVVQRERKSRLLFAVVEAWSISTLFMSPHIYRLLTCSFRTFLDSTVPVVEHYAKQGKVFRVNGYQPVEKVSAPNHNLTPTTHVTSTHACFQGVSNCANITTRKCFDDAFL